MPDDSPAPGSVIINEVVTTPEVEEGLREDLGLNDPLPVQYFYWARGVLSGDLGWSGVAAAPVAQRTTSAGRDELP